MTQDDVPLGKVCFSIRRGISPKYSESGLLVINQKCVRDGQLLLRQARRHDSSLRMVDEGRLVKKFDVLVNSTGVGTLGRVAIVRHEPIERMCVDSHVTIVRPNAEIIDPLFLGYVLFAGQAQIEGMASGATGQTELAPQRLRNDFYIPVPKKNIQQRIATTLLAYDDLIELNRRRIAILEEMANHLFDEWFVKFRFPNNGADKYTDPKIGKPPSSWPLKVAKEIINFDPTTKVSKENTKPFVPMTSLSVNSMVINDIEMRSGNSGAKFQKGDTLLARITPCLENGKTGYVDFLNDEEVGFGSTEFIVMRGKTVSPEWVYLLARTELFRAHAIKSMSGATGRQRVNRDGLEGYRVVEPDAKTMTLFTNIVRPIFKQVHILAQMNKNLIDTRDYLLPKLISGEIDFCKAERKIERAITRAAK